jgi:hypothetical protein
VHSIHVLALYYLLARETVLCWEVASRCSLTLDSSSPAMLHTAVRGFRGRPTASHGWSRSHLVRHVSVNASVGTPVNWVRAG